MSREHPEFMSRGHPKLMSLKFMSALYTYTYIENNIPWRTWAEAAADGNMWHLTH